MNLPLVLAAVLLAGCAGSTYTVAPEAFEDARRDLSGRTVTLVLTDGARYSAASLRLEADTTTWVNPDTGELLALPTWALAEVQHRDRGRSALRTAGAGALVTGAIGGTLGALLCAGLDCGASQPLVVLGAAASAAPSGALYGALGGAIANRADRWLFAPARPPDAARTNAVAR